MAIKLNAKYKEILKTDKRYILITGGRNSSKSFSVNTLACLLTYEKGHRILFTRYTMTSAKISIIPEFEEKIELLEVPHHFKTLQTSVENLTTGSDIIFRGIKSGSKAQTANLKSIHGITYWILEEGEELQDENTFDTIDLSVRAGKDGGKIIIIMNPTTQDHWIWKRWFENNLHYVNVDGHKIPVSSHPEILHIHTTYLDNLKHIPRQYLKNILTLKANNVKKYILKILGAWMDKAEGVIYENWEEGEFNEALSYCYGLDFGFYPDPLAMIKVAVDIKGKKVYVKEEIYKQEISTENLVKMIKARIKKKNDLIVCDTNESRTLLSLRKEGLNAIKAIKGKGSIVEGIRNIQDFKIIVDPTSYNLKKELNNYVWNDKKSSIPVDDNNHLLDALRYAYKKLTLRKGKGVKAG